MSLPALKGNLDKQGYLGELRNKTPQELKELLKRQQSLKANVKFIQRLPDKGEKIERMVERLEELLAQHKDVDNTAQMFEKMALDANKAQQQRVPQSGEDVNDDDEEDDPDQLKHVVNRAAQEKYINSYERVIRRAEEKPHKQKFLPHQTIHSKDFTELEEKIDILSLKTRKGDVGKDFDPTYGKPPAESDSPKSGGKVDAKSPKSPGPIHNAWVQSPQNTPDKQNASTQHKTLQDQGTPEGVKLKKRYDESLMPTPSMIKCSAAKLIDISESSKLQTEQKHKQDEIQAKNAARRLAERLHIRMSNFEPEGSAKMSFREPQPEPEQEDEGLDSDDAEQDYPD